MLYQCRSTVNNLHYISISLRYYIHITYYVYKCMHKTYKRDCKILIFGGADHEIVHYIE